MADNYLEKRMEDLRSGRLASEHRSAASPLRKGYLHFPFPPRRVLVTGGTAGTFRAIAEAFLKAGCKVAVFGHDREAGDRIAHDLGARFHCVDLTSVSALKEAFGNLVKAWKDIDIIITGSRPDISETLAAEWICHRNSLPIPNSFGGRFIVIKKEETSALNHRLKVSLSEFGITFNNILMHNEDTALESTAARIALFLSVPGKGTIDGAEIPLKI